MWDLKNNKQAEQKQTHKYREHFDSCMLGGVGMGEKGTGIKYELVVTK